LVGDEVSRAAVSQLIPARRPSAARARRATVVGTDIGFAGAACPQPPRKSSQQRLNIRFIGCGVSPGWLPRSERRLIAVFHLYSSKMLNN